MSMKSRKGEPRICPVCERREHKTGKGICQFCWGTGMRRPEFRRIGIPCDVCMIIQPQPPVFCIHNKQLFSCEICLAEMRDIGLDTERNREFVFSHIKRRLEKV